MEDIVLDSFPFDSMQVLNEDTGQMEDDRLYEAQIFRNYFKKFLSNGVYYGSYKNYGENGMKVTSEGGMLINVAPGAGIIEGADFENTSNREITLVRPDSGRRLDRIVVQFNASLNKRNTFLIVKEGNGTTPATLTRNDNIYEICIAEVMVKSTANITQSDITDTRPNSNLCGIVDSLISVDGEELYQSFQNYIDTLTDNIMIKNQDIIQTLDGCDNQNAKVASAKLFFDTLNNVNTLITNINNTINEIQNNIPKIVVLTGYFGSNQSIKNINLPSGWSIDNTVVLSSLIYLKYSTGYDTYDGNDIPSSIPKHEVHMENYAYPNRLTIEVSRTASNYETIRYRIVIMKFA
ncbi:MAG: hypothetical protein IKE01_06665 [Clostridia bacterium]|nr:hypothetical protein [Clostridia bacterium]